MELLLRLFINKLFLGFSQSAKEIQVLAKCRMTDGDWRGGRYQTRNIHDKTLFCKIESWENYKQAGPLANSITNGMLYICSLCVCVCVLYGHWRHVKMNWWTLEHANNIPKSETAELRIELARTAQILFYQLKFWRVNRLRII